MKSFRFVHAADIHLDSPLRGLSGHQGRAADRIRTATREAFQNLVSETIQERASFLVIAGDLYDGDWRDYQTGLFFVGQTARLVDAGIPAYVLFGNHDAESQITKRLTLPEGVHTFGSRKPETFEIDNLDVAIHGQSYKKRDITDNLVPAYPSPLPHRFNIGVLHTGLGGMGGHQNYAPCALGELKTKGYDYWALGHVHGREVLHEDPHVVFSGNLQGRHIRETGPKSASLVTVEAGEVVSVEPIETDVVRWIQLDVDVTGCANVPSVSERVRDTIESAVSTNGRGRLLACRLTLTGTTECHGSLLSAVEALLADARAAALGLGEEAAWVEKLVIATTPSIDPAVLRAREDAVGELQRIIEHAGEDGELLRQLKTHIGGLVATLPHEVRANTDDPLLQTAVDDEIDALLSHLNDYLISYLSAREPS